MTRNTIDGVVLINSSTLSVIGVARHAISTLPKLEGMFENVHVDIRAQFVPL